VCAVLKGRRSSDNAPVIVWLVTPYFVQVVPVGNLCAHQLEYRCGLAHMLSFVTVQSEVLGYKCEFLAEGHRISSSARQMPSSRTDHLLPGSFGHHPCSTSVRSYPECARPVSQPGIGTYFNPGVVGPLFAWFAKIADEAFAWYSIQPLNRPTN